MNARKLMAVTAICVATASSPSWAADMTISTDYVLNDDLTVDGTLTVASGATVDLNGHKLSVKGLAGTGSITDSNQSYELLDYIEATGAQHIDTDIVPGANTAVDVVATATTAAGNNQTLFGDGWGTFYLCMAQGTTWYCLFNKSVADPSLKGNRRRVVVGNGTATIYDGKTGAVIGTTQPSFSNTSGKVLSICGLSDNSYHGYWRIHSFKISHDGEMRFDFVPARDRATGRVGLLNQLNGRFYPSETDVEFVAGPSTGGLHVEAASEVALADFSGTVDSTVSMVLEGECTLTANADWRRFATLRIEGVVNLNGHDLWLNVLPGTGTITDEGDSYLEYVESNGSQLVATGIVPSTDTAVECDLTYHAANGDGKVLFGCDKWSGTRYMMVKTAGQFYFFGNSSTYGTPATGTRYMITVTPGTSPNGTINVVNTATGAVVSKTDSLTNGGNSELRLFGVSNDSTRNSTYRLHSFKITKAGVLKRDLVPMRKNGKVGLYDRVTGDFLVSNTGVDLIAGPVSAEAGAAGSLHVDVAEGRTVVADTLALSGSLVLVKKGAGTLFMNRPGQTYMGGTCVAGGVLTTKSGGAQNVSIAGDAYFGKPGSRIMADAGGVFDFNGNSDYRIYNIVLNGGTLRNGGYDQAQNQGSLGHLTITTNSVIETKFNITVFNATTDLWNLGGYTLSVDTLGKTLYFRDSVVLTNGVFWLKGDGCWHVNAAVQARGVNLRAESMLWLGAKVDVDDYYAACTNNVNNGTAAMNVYGRFTPATDYFYGCTLQDGATLDLNGRNGAWSTTSAFTSGANHVTFASGATITVDVSTRPTFTGKIVDWGVGNTPSDVTFKLDAASKAMGRMLQVKDDGLYAAGGMMIIVR